MGGEVLRPDELLETHGGREVTRPGFGPHSPSRVASSRTGESRASGTKSRAERNEGLSSRIATEVRIARARLRITQQELATRSGLSRGFVSQVERAASTPSVESLTRIARALDKPLDDFVRGVEL